MRENSRNFHTVEHDSFSRNFCVKILNSIVMKPINIKGPRMSAVRKGPRKNLIARKMHENDDFYVKITNFNVKFELFELFELFEYLIE